MLVIGIFTVCRQRCFALNSIIDLICYSNINNSLCKIDFCASAFAASAVFRSKAGKGSGVSEIFPVLEEPSFKRHLLSLNCDNAVVLGEDLLYFWFCGSYPPQKD